MITVGEARKIVSDAQLKLVTELRRKEKARQARREEEERKFKEVFSPECNDRILACFSAGCPRATVVCESSRTLDFEGEILVATNLHWVNEFAKEWEDRGFLVTVTELDQGVADKKVTVEIPPR